MTGRPARYYKLIVDGRTVEVFRASQASDRHKRMARLHGCHVQPALASEYQAYLKTQPRRTRQNPH